MNVRISVGEVRTRSAVATGQFGAAELTEAGAHAVLPDLADTSAAVAAILGAPSG